MSNEVPDRSPEDTPPIPGVGDRADEHAGFPGTAIQSDRSASEEAEGEGKYVYCIIRGAEERDFGPIGIGDGSSVHTLSYRDLSAVVSDTPIRIYDPTRENVFAHDRVNKAVMEEFTVIPMSFGTMFRTRADIVALLKSTYDALEDVFDKMEEKVELGLKVLWSREQVVASVEEEDPDIRNLKSEIVENARGSTYFARIQLGRILERRLEEIATRYVNDIHRALEPTAVASRTNKPIGDRMILNAAYLVDRAREPDFRSIVEKLGEQYGDRLDLTATGPWPPYNFVNIKLRLERADE